MDKPHACDPRSGSERNMPRDLTAMTPHLPAEHEQRVRVARLPRRAAAWARLKEGEICLRTSGTLGFFAIR